MTVLIETFRKAAIILNRECVSSGTLIEKEIIGFFIVFCSFSFLVAF